MKKTILTGLAALTIGISTSCTTPKLNPNKYLRNISGQTIEIQPKNPSKYIIHIKQRHFTRPSLGIEISENILEEISKLSKEKQKEFWAPVRNEYFITNEYQEKIEQLLLKFSEIGNTNIYSEGVFSPQTRNELIQSHLSDLDELIDYHIIQKEEKAILTQLPGATRYLAIEGKCNIIPAEKEELLYATINAMGSTNSNQNLIDKLNEERETHAIKTLITSSDKYPILVFGKAHYLNNNVNQYNKDNPDNQVGLITYEF